ncbi:hypothetical protein [Polaribacter sp. M15]
MEIEKDEKIKRLKSLEDKIDIYSENEYHFDSIESLLNNEITKEKESLVSRENYLNQLESIVKYELLKYKGSIKRKPVKGNINDYLALTTRFGLVVSGELIHIKSRK